MKETLPSLSYTARFVSRKWNFVDVCKKLDVKMIARSNLIRCAEIKESDFD